MTFINDPTKQAIRAGRADMAEELADGQPRKANDPRGVIYNLCRDTMGLIERIKRTVSGDRDEPTYTYQCTVCHAEFESAESHMGAVGCPECGANSVQSVAE